MTDDHHGAVVKAGEAAHDRAIIAEGPVAVELEKIAEDLPNVIECAGALGVPGQLGPLPRRQLPVEFMLQLGKFHPQLADLVLDSGFCAAGSREFFDLFLDFTERFFKLKVIAHCGMSPDSPGIGWLRYQR